MSILEQCINAKLEFFQQRIDDLTEKSGQAFNNGNITLAEYYMGKMEGYRAAQKHIRDAIREVKELGA